MIRAKLQIEVSGSKTVWLRQENSTCHEGYSPGGLVIRSRAEIAALQIELEDAMNAWRRDDIRKGDEQKWLKHF